MLAALLWLPALGSEDAALETRPSTRVIELTAFTRPRARLPLVAEIGGRVEEVRYDIGEPIGADGLFAQIDATFLRLELEDNTVEQERLRDQIAFDAREVKRNQQLARNNNVAAAQLDQASQTLSNDNQALKRLDVQARVLNEKIARTRVLAPPGWKLIDRRIEPGQWVNDGERLGEVADFSTLLLPFALTPGQLEALNAMPEPLRVELPELTVQQSLDLPAWPRAPNVSIEVPATIYRINPALDDDTRKIMVELQLQDRIERQRGGLRARLRLPLSDPDNLLIPAGAVHRGFEESWVQPLTGEPVTVTILGSERIEGEEWLRARAPGLAPGTGLQPRE